jgi:hypothetical protein
MYLQNVIEEIAAIQKDIANKGKEEGNTQKGKVTD